MIGRSQPMKSWRPPSSATSLACSDFTVAVEASGTNAGVRTGPCPVWMTPARAAPSRAVISKAGTTPENNEAARGRPRLDRLCGRRSSFLGRAFDGRGLSVPVAAGAGDRYTARLALLGLRDPDLEHAVAEGRLDPVRVHAVRERQRAAEAAERALDAIPALLALLVLGPALARDGERAVLHLDVHVALAQAGKVRPEDEVVLRLDEVDRRHPPPGLVGLSEECVEDAVDLTGKRLWLHQ